ncbi:MULTISPECIES: PspC domain-containing protein [unclassified Candidatus Paralachnospira]|uniref:PspC domain-containing protein n=1 Tax=unclassified Candidatus Paralachnospira TaxID=3099471 RepID=UPI003F92872C
MEPKRLYRSTRDKLFLGVCGGIGEYFNIDATIIRVIWAIFGCTGAGILAYFIAAVLMPSDPS